MFAVLDGQHNGSVSAMTGLSTFMFDGKGSTRDLAVKTCTFS